MNVDLVRAQPGALKPRAVAVLCCLRGGAKTSIQIRNCIGDRTLTSTRDLLGDMRGMDLVGQRSGDERWYLYEGVGWLETNGLSVVSEHAAHGPDRAVQAQLAQEDPTDERGRRHDSVGGEDGQRHREIQRDEGAARRRARRVVNRDQSAKRRRSTDHVADHAAYERAWTLGVPAQRRRDPPHFTQDEIAQHFRARGRTIVPLAEYRSGSFEGPVVLIGRELSLDEVDVVSGPGLSPDGASE